MQVYCNNCDMVLIMSEIEFNENLLAQIKNKVVVEINEKHRGHFLSMDLTNEKLTGDIKLKKAKQIYDKNKIDKLGTTKE